jgi:ferrochelatase
VQAQLGDSWTVRLAMRYGQPQLTEALLAMLDCDRIVALPLYPQYSAASTGSSLELLYAEASKPWVTPNLSVVPPFYRDPGYLACFAARGRALIEQETARPHPVFVSRPTRAADQEVRCQRRTLPGQVRLLRSDRLGQSSLLSRPVLRHHSLAGDTLNLSPDDYSTCFQSRLGRTPWIRPYTDEVIPALLAKGKKRLVVFCPAFVADCLETLEEIGIRAEHDFVAKGGGVAQARTFAERRSGLGPWCGGAAGVQTQRRG